MKLNRLGSLLYISFKRIFYITIFGLLMFSWWGCKKKIYKDLQKKTEVETLLSLVWKGLKNHFITAEGRVIRPKNENDTVSEGQAYAMLQAVWMDDQETFDKCYRWTENNLSRKSLTGDHLLAWWWKNR